LNQKDNYKPFPLGGSNQPLLYNIGKALQHQARIRQNTRLSSDMFTEDQLSFILQHLKWTDYETYHKIMGG
jgi:hypothetical protein